LDKKTPFWGLDAIVIFPIPHETNLRDTRVNKQIVPAAGTENNGIKHKRLSVLEKKVVCEVQE
jgi:hypothetical protein